MDETMESVLGLLGIVLISAVCGFIPLFAYDTITVGLMGMYVFFIIFFILICSTILSNQMGMIKKE